MEKQPNTKKRRMDHSNLKLDQKQEKPKQSKTNQNPDCILAYGTSFVHKPKWFSFEKLKGKKGIWETVQSKTDKEKASNLLAKVAIKLYVIFTWVGAIRSTKSTEQHTLKAAKMQRERDRVGGRRPKKCKKQHQGLQEKSVIYFRTCIE